MNAKIIAIANQKGGCAKTTTAVTLASGLKFYGKKALLLDLDPQCNSTDNYRAQIHQTNTVYDVFVNNAKMSECIQHTEAGDIIAADRLLIEVPQRVPDRPVKFNIIKSAIQELRPLYDYIIIDTPPTLGLLLYNGLVAADELIVPLLPARFAISGMSDLKDTIQEVKDVNKKFKIAGILFVRANANQVLTKEVAELLPALCQKLDTKCYSSTIRDSVVVGKAQAQIQTLFEYESAVSPKNPIPVVTDYRNFIEEFLKGE